MKKKEYIIPEVLVVESVLENLLYETSVPGGNPDEGEPESNTGLFDEDASGDIKSMPSMNRKVWAGYDD